MRRALPVAVALLLAACAPVTSHGGPVRDHVSFVDALRARNIAVDIAAPTPSLFPIRGTATRLVLNGGGISQATLDSYNYDPTDLRPLGDATRVAEDDEARFGTMLFGRPFRAYRQERVIVIYEGDDAAVKRLLAELLGAPFDERP